MKLPNRSQSPHGTASGQEFITTGRGLRRSVMTQYADAQIWADDPETEHLVHRHPTPTLAV